MNKQIKLWRNDQGWVADFLVGGQPNPEIIALFRTHRLPTAYPSCAPLVHVLRQLERMNPDTEVIYDATQDDDHHDA